MKKYKWLIILFVIIFLIWCLSIYVLKLKTNLLTERALFGDTFGGINSLFSGLALAGIIYTIFLQKDEMAQTREILILQQKEFELQNKTLLLQRFETTFFNLVSLHHQIIDSIEFELEDSSNNKLGKFVRRRDFFKVSFETFIGSISGLSKDKVEEKYAEFYNKNKTNLGHYFRNLYRIFKFVNETEFYKLADCEDNEEMYNNKNYTDRYKYTSMIRAQLSDYELGIIFYNLGSNDGEKFRELSNKYWILKNLPHDSVNMDYKIYKNIVLYADEPEIINLLKSIGK